MKVFKIFANQYFWLTLIIAFGFLVRLYKLDSPIADWHSWRQADTAAVTRNFIKLGFNPFFPKYDDMSGVAEKPIVNPAGFRFVEFPVYNIVVYPLYLLFGIDDKYHRLVSIIFSLSSTVFLFFIVKKYAGTAVGLLTAFTFVALPFNIFFSRTTLPETTFVFFALGMIYFVDKWIWEGKKSLGLLGFVFTSIAFLTKPWAIFFYLPLLYSLYFKQKSRKFWIKFLALSLVALSPFILWRLWILQQPEGIPASNWLLNGDGIRFRPAFWWWIISERMGREILGVTGIVLFFIGLISRPKNGYFLHFWALSSFLFIAVVATGNVRHNYYQILFIPVACIFFAQGFIQLLKGNSVFIPRIWTILLGLILFPLAFYFGFKMTKDFYNVNNPSIVEAGEVADRILPKNAIVLAPYNGDTAFLYQTNRLGFAAGVLPIPELVADFGVSYYISTTKDDKTRWVMRHFEVLVDNPHFVIASLTKFKVPIESSDPEP
ncbi:MAG: glycosyltransferase family 39 protein [Candidatus Daviesbacteria bacterium]|nr:glycosyltransferase family 39 protein [Candidatus Daviesbacteria bacterium]